MNQSPNDPLPMPADVKAQANPDATDTPLLEPPSAKLIVRLFLIPFIIVGLAVGVMFLIGRMAGGTPTLDESLRGLRSSGGERTVDVLLGPGSKQRFLYAKTLVDQMKQGMSDADRIELTNNLIDILDHYTRAEEGEVQHALLLVLGRAWQVDSNRPETDSTEASASRAQAAATLLRYADAPQIPTRKAAVLAMAYWAGRSEVKQFLPKLIEAVRGEKEDLDVRLAAATALGPLAKSGDTAVVDALQFAMRDTDPREVELVWGAALSLAQLNHVEVADTILKLLDRNELSKLEYYDREADPKNPTFRKLTDQEQQRILINTMIGAHKLNVPAVQEKLKQLTDNDPSPRVRAAGKDLLPTH